MGGDQTITDEKDNMIEILDVAVTFPVPADEISGGQVAQRKYFSGIAAADQHCVDQPSCSGLAVRRRHAARNVKSATAMRRRLIANATGHEVSAIVANWTLRNRRSCAKVAVAGSIRPKVAVRDNIARVVVGV